MLALSAMLRSKLAGIGEGPIHGGQAWVGQSPTGSSEEIALALAANLPGSASRDVQMAGCPLYRLTRSQAAALITMATSQSLAYGFPSPAAPDAIGQTEVALAELKDDAEYLTNGDWMEASPGQGSLWHSVFGEMTFEVAVFGFDAETAFVLFVEEDN